MSGLFIGNGLGKEKINEVLKNMSSMCGVSAIQFNILLLMI